MIQGKNTDYYLTVEELLEALKDLNNRIEQLQESKANWKFIALVNTAILVINWVVNLFR